MNLMFVGRSREGAWIEIILVSCLGSDVKRRSREGAWIEIKIRFLCCGEYGVAPARERGLKLILFLIVSFPVKSLPRGSVD